MLLNLMKPNYLVTGLVFLLAGTLSAQNVFQKTYGGTNVDYAEGIKITADGGFIISGSTGSFGTVGATNPQDFYLSKANLLGITTWTRELGFTSARQEGRAVITMMDGGYMQVGRTFQSSIDGNDNWLIKKYDAAGTAIHERLF